MAADGAGQAKLTVAGHSYGGAVLGQAEHLGLYADRTLYIEAAGMGNGIWSPSDLHNANPNVQRYTMTVPTDPIVFSQRSGWTVDQMLGHGSVTAALVSHGANPQDFPGMTVLEPGKDGAGKPLSDYPQFGNDASHNAVFHSDTDSFQNMYEVFTGGKVKVMPAHPTQTCTPTGKEYPPVTCTPDTVTVDID
jgi:hypothetical protein